MKRSHRTKKSKERMKLYIEAGLAVFLVAALTFAGAADAFTEQEETRKESAKAVTADEADGKEAAAAEKEAEEKDAAKQEEAADASDSDERYPIMGQSDITVQEMVDYFNDSGEIYPAEELSEGGADSIETFCQIYYEEAEAEGVRPEVAFAQTMKETGFLQYGGDASIEQFNFAGIGTTGGGVPGNSYPDVRTGVRAQIQHLKAYATTDALEQECVDDRYQYVKKGAAPYVEWLGQQENPQGVGWATGENYGYDIVQMIRDMQEG